MPLPTTPYILSTNAWEFITAADYPAMRDFIGIGPTDTLSLANLNTTSASLSASTPFTINQTWNNAAIAFNALTVKATNTNSAAASKLLDLQVGPNSLFSVRKDGAIIGTNTNTIFGGGTGSFFPGRVHVGDYNFSVGSNVLVQIAIEVDGSDSANAVILNKDAGIYWSSLASANNIITLRSSTDLALRRDGAANTLALRNDDFAQTFNMYGTYSSAGANYARLAFSCAANGNATISTQASGTGVAGTVSINGVPVGRGKGSNTVRNISIGDNSLGLNSTGADNTAVGFYALGGNGAGSYNTSFGSQSLFSSNSNHNVALGYLAGTFKTGGATNNPGNENIYIGSQTKALDTAQTNQIVIGYDATGIGSNSVVLGNDSITKTALKGNVGIGTTAPSEKLHVVGNGLFGQKTSVPAAAPVNVSFGGTYGTSTPGSKANLKWDLYTDNIDANRFGIGMSANLMEFQAGQNAGFGFYPNSGTTSAMHIISSGNVGIGTTSPSSKLQVSAGDIEVDTSANGIILKSPDGTRYRVTVANGGTLTVAAA